MKEQGIPVYNAKKGFFIRLSIDVIFSARRVVTDSRKRVVGKIGTKSSK
jgi:hypothetical protein